MGECCADWVLNRRPFGHDPMTLQEFERTYGRKGHNFAVISEGERTAAILFQFASHLEDEAEGKQP